MCFPLEGYADRLSGGCPENAVDHRLRQRNWTDNRTVAVSALVRGSYHLYQGLGGFTGNVVMGLVFGRLYQRWGRTTPLVLAHTLMDSVAFVGYAPLSGHVGWLPTPGHWPRSTGTSASKITCPERAPNVP